MNDKKSVTDEKSVETIETGIVKQRTPIDTSGAAIYYETDGTVLSADDAPDSSVIDDGTNGTDDTDAETKDGTSDSNDDTITEEMENDDGSADNGTDDADKDGDGSSDTDDDASEEASDDANTEDDNADDIQGGVSRGVTDDDADDKGDGASDGDVASEVATDDESADTKATADDDSDEDDDEDDEDDGDIDCPTGWGPVVTKDERDYVTIKGHSFKPLTLCKVFAALTVAPLAISCGLSFAHMVANFELGFWHYFVAACIYGALLVACLYSIGSFVAANDRYEKALHHCVTYDELSMLIEERGISIVCFGFFAILSIIASIVVGVIMFCIF